MRTKKGLAMGLEGARPVYHDNMPERIISAIKVQGHLAQAKPDMVFTSLAHRIDLSLLRKSFRQLRKNESTGVDKVTARQYAKDLEENLYNLYQRLRRGQYVASPVKRIWLDKEDGKERPIGITALEDKIVQKAVVNQLGAVYEPIFHGFSHGFRSGHSQHQALAELRETCYQLNVNWILSADITLASRRREANQGGPSTFWGLPFIGAKVSRATGR